ncbi:MAG: hypothetical protein ACLFPX_00910 [Candidatus Omnitrophota bacterium]
MDADQTITIGGIFWAGIRDAFHPGSLLSAYLFVFLLFGMLWRQRRYVFLGWLYLALYMAAVFALILIGIDLLLQYKTVLAHILEGARLVLAVSAAVFGVLMIGDLVKIKRGTPIDQAFFRSVYCYVPQEVRRGKMISFIWILMIVVMAVFAALLQASWPMDDYIAGIFLQALQGKVEGFLIVIVGYALILPLPHCLIFLGIHRYARMDIQRRRNRLTRILAVVSGFSIAIAFGFGFII